MNRALLLLVALLIAVGPVAEARREIPVRANLAPGGPVAARGDVDLAVAERWWAAFQFAASGQVYELLEEEMDLAFRIHQSNPRIIFGGMPERDTDSDAPGSSVEVQDAQIRILKLDRGADWWTAGELPPGSNRSALAFSSCDFSLAADWVSSLNGFDRSRPPVLYPEARPLGATCTAPGPSRLLGSTVIFWNTVVEIRGHKPAASGGEPVSYTLTAGVVTEMGLRKDQFVQVTFREPAEPRPLEPTRITLVASAFHVYGPLELLPGRGTIVRGEHEVTDPVGTEDLDGAFELRRQNERLVVTGMAVAADEDAPAYHAGFVAAGALTAAAGLWSAFRRLGWLGLLGRRGEGALEHRHRRTIHDLVRGSPGVSLRRLVEVMGIPRTTVRHHLTALARGRLVELQTIGREVCAFPPQLPEPDRLRLRLMQTPRARAIVGLLRQGDSLTQTEFQQQLSLSQPQVSRLVSRLERAGVVRSEWGTGRLRYRLGTIPTGEGAEDRHRSGATRVMA